MNRKTIFVLVLTYILFGAGEARALQIGGALNPEEGDKVVRMGFNGLIGIISPPVTFSHPDGFNDARQFEEYLGFSYGMGDFVFKDLVFDSKITFYQTNEEKLNGTIIHTRDRGLYLSFKLSGNFVHLPKFTFGAWFQTDIPIDMEKEKFVKPNVNYVGMGVSAVGELVDNFFLSQTVFVGSGLFKPKTKNVNLISNTLPAVNFGQIFSDFDFLFTSGLAIEADITRRTDVAYEQSALADGGISNLVFITPFIINFPFSESVSSQGGLAVKWAGKSTRGSMFFNFELAFKF